MPNDRPDAPIAIAAATSPSRSVRSIYPEPFAARMNRRVKRPLGDQFGLKNFGVNQTTLEPGGESALMHRHTRQDEFIYIISGRPTLMTDRGEVELSPGMCAGFPAAGIAHQLVNRSGEPVVYLEIGDRTSGDKASYPVDDIVARAGPDGKRLFFHKDGTPY